MVGFQCLLILLIHAIDDVNEQLRAKAVDDRSDVAGILSPEYLVDGPEVIDILENVVFVFELFFAKGLVKQFFCFRKVLFLEDLCFVFDLLFHRLYEVWLLSPINLNLISY